MNTSLKKSMTPAQQLRQTLRAMAHEFAISLPSHITPQKFERVVMTVVQLKPELLDANRQSLLASCLNCAKDGLVPDGREATLALFNKRVQYIPMFFGIQKRIRNSGEISSIQAHVIYEHDKFVVHRGLNEMIEHEPHFPGNRGNPIGAYAIAKFRDRNLDPVFEVMSVDEIEKTRRASRSPDKGPWVDWWEEMARKSVFRRLAKWLPMDADMDILLRRDDQAGDPVIDSTTDIPSSVTIEHDDFEALSAGEIQSQLDELSSFIEADSSGA